MEFVGAKLKSNMDNKEFAEVIEMFCKKPNVRDVNVAKGHKHMGRVCAPLCGASLATQTAQWIWSSRRFPSRRE